MQTKHIALGAGIFSITSWTHKDFLDIERVAHIGSIRLNHGGMGFQAEFNLGLAESQSIIDALQQHINHIQEAQASLATSPQQEAA